MENAFIYLKRLGIKQVLQGDLLFDDDIKQSTGDSITFQPNTIVYKVDAGTDLYNQVARARLGIAFHTTYVGDTLANMDAQFGADISGLKKTNDVWVDDATIKNISGTVTLNKQEELEIRTAIKILGTSKVSSNVWSALASGSLPEGASRWRQTLLCRLQRRCRSPTILTRSSWRARALTVTTQLALVCTPRTPRLYHF